MSQQLENAIAAGMWAALFVLVMLMLALNEQSSSLEQERTFGVFGVLAALMFVSAVTYSTYVWS